MASRRGKKWKQWQILFSWAPKSLQTVTAAMKLTFSPQKENFDKLSILKNRAITLFWKVHVVKAMVFFSSHVQMWNLYHKEGWVPEMWCVWIVMLQKTLESPLVVKEDLFVVRKLNQSIKINPEYSLEGLMLKLKLQYFGRLMQIANSLKKTLMLRMIEGRRRKGHQKMTLG